MVRIVTTNGTDLSGAHIEHPEILLDNVERLVNVIKIGQRLRLGCGKDETFHEAADIDSHMSGRNAEPINDSRLGIFLDVWKETNIRTVARRITQLFTITFRARERNKREVKNSTTYIPSPSPNVNERTLQYWDRRTIEQSLHPY